MPGVRHLAQDRLAFDPLSTRVKCVRELPDEAERSLPAMPASRSARKGTPILTAAVALSAGAEPSGTRARAPAFRLSPAASASGSSAEHVKRSARGRIRIGTAINASFAGRASHGTRVRGVACAARRPPRRDPPQPPNARHRTFVPEIPNCEFPQVLQSRHPALRWRRGTAKAGRRLASGMDPCKVATPAGSFLRNPGRRLEISRR